MPAVGVCCCYSLWTAFWLTEWMSWPEVFWGRAARRVLLFSVNWGYPIVWEYNSRENKSRNPFPSIVQLLTSPDCLIIDLDSITNNYIFSYERLFSFCCWGGIQSIPTFYYTKIYTSLFLLKGGQICRF